MTRRFEAPLLAPAVISGFVAAVLIGGYCLVVKPISSSNSISGILDSLSGSCRFFEAQHVRQRRDKKAAAAATNQPVKLKGPEMSRAGRIVVPLNNEHISAREANADYYSAPTLHAAAEMYVLQPPQERPRRSLSAREREVLYWLALGRSGKDIARTLNIGVCTVRAHIRNIMRKLDAVNIPHAVARAFQEGTLPLTDRRLATIK